jgi:phytanoyl-CoA hydroxylase
VLIRLSVHSTLQDEHPIPTRDRSLCAIWIALSDATLENGALWVVSGSHKQGIIYDRQPHTLPTVDSMPQAVGFESALSHGGHGGGDIAPPVMMPIPLAQGDVLCFNGYLLHSSLPNYTDSCRPALTR